jgi:hypothetical protein
MKKEADGATNMLRGWFVLVAPNVTILIAQEVCIHAQTNSNNQIILIDPKAEKLSLNHERQMFVNSV